MTRETPEYRGGRHVEKSHLPVAPARRDRTPVRRRAGVAHLRPKRRVGLHQQAGAGVPQTHHPVRGAREAELAPGGPAHAQHRPGAVRVRQLPRWCRVQAPRARPAHERPPDTLTAPAPPRRAPSGTLRPAELVLVLTSSRPSSPLLAKVRERVGLPRREGGEGVRGGHAGGGEVRICTGRHSLRKGFPLTSGADCFELSETCCQEGGLGLLPAQAVQQRVLILLGDFLQREIGGCQQAQKFAGRLLFHVMLEEEEVQRLN